jgi:DNA-binding MarR family transcriptional regulator
LAAVAELGSGQAEVTSSQVRKVVGISQQLLNRHLRGLESQGLVELEHRGPGLPLVVRITSAGLRALERRRPHSEPVTEAQVAPSPSVRQAPPPAARSPLLSPRLERFARSLYRALDAYLPGLGWEDFLALVAPALKRRPLAMALYEALEPHLARGMSLELFTQVLREVARRLKEAGTPRGRPAVRRPKPAVSEGPPLGPAEAALERRLEQTMNPRYRGMPWYQRTRELSNEWDRARRRHLGLFSTAFDSFRPRWERPDWDDFNQARRQADARGALYSDWVQAQFERLAALGEDHVPPSQLHGQEAIEAWQERFGVEEGEAAPLGPAPYTIDTFRLDDPQHVAYAERVIREIEELARRVLGGEDETVVRLLVEAVSAGNLPAAALELAPRYKEQVLADLARRQAKASRRAPAASSISGSTPRTRIII